MGAGTRRASFTRTTGPLPSGEVPLSRSAASCKPVCAYLLCMGGIAVDAPARHRYFDVKEAHHAGDEAYRGVGPGLDRYPAKDVDAVDQGSTVYRAVATDGGRRVGRAHRARCLRPRGESGLEAQRTWTRLWLRSLGTDEQAPPVMADWGRFLLTLAESWTDAQGRLWEIWSESVQSLGPGAAVAAWEQAIHAWRLALQASLEGQTPLVVRDSAADTAGREAYCMKCRQKRPLIDGRKVTMKNGRAAIQSRCPVCGSTLNLILPAPAATAGDAANGWMRHSRQ